MHCSMKLFDSFLVAAGAENWAKAHGVEMCAETDLVSGEHQFVGCYELFD